MKRLTLLIMIIISLLILSCQTEQDRYFSSLTEEDNLLMQKTEVIFAKSLISSEVQHEEIMAGISRLSGIETLDKKFKAKIASMEIIYNLAFKNKEVKQFKKELKSIEMLNKKEPLFKFINLWHQPFSKDLEALKTDNKNNLLIQSLLVNLYNSSRQLKKAAATIETIFTITENEEILTVSNNKYLELNKQIKISETSKNVEILNPAAETMTINEMITYTGAKAAQKEIALDCSSFLLTLSALYESKITVTSSKQATRQDASLLLLELVILLENTNSLRNSYSEYFESNGIESDIEDINTSHIAFDAVYTLFERNLMQLEDGLNFFPGKKITPMSYIEILNNLLDFYL